MRYKGWMAGLLIGLMTCEGSAQLVDDFGVGRNYADPLFDFTAPEVIWDGILAPDGTTGTDVFNDGNVQLADTTTNAGEFTLESSASNWNRQGGDAGFLYIDNVTTDFIAEVDMTFVDTGNNNEAGLSVRLDTDQFDPSMTFNVQSRVRGWQSTDVQLRSVTGTSQFDGSDSVGLGAQTIRLRLRRDGDTLITSYSTDGGATYLSPGTVDSVERPDFEGQSLQVGLFQAGYNTEESRSARFDNFFLDTFVRGDVTGDGLVTEADYVTIRENLFTSPAQRSDGDLNFDAKVDFADFHLWKDAAAPAVVAAALGLTATVPEPAGAFFVFVACGALAMHVRRNNERGSRTISQ